MARKSCTWSGNALYRRPKVRAKASTSLTTLAFLQTAMAATQAVLASREHQLAMCCAGESVSQQAPVR